MIRRSIFWLLPGNKELELANNRLVTKKLIPGKNVASVSVTVFLIELWVDGGRGDQYNKTDGPRTSRILLFPFS